MFLLNLLLIFCTGSFSLTLAKLPMSEQVARSSYVVKAVVESVEYEKKSYPDADPNMIFTRYRIRILKDGGIKRSQTASDILNVYEVGGKIGNESMDFAGMYRLEKGKEYVLFLKSVNGLLRVSGANQGVFKYRENAYGKKTVSPYENDEAVYVGTSSVKSFVDLGEHDYDDFVKIVKKHQSKLQQGEK